MLILYSCDTLWTVSQLVCCVGLSGLLHLSLPGRSSHKTLWPLPLQGEPPWGQWKYHLRFAKREGERKTQDSNRETLTYTHTQRKERKLYSGRDSGVSPHGNHVQNVVSNSRQCLRAVSICELKCVSGRADLIPSFPKSQAPLRSIFFDRLKSRVRRKPSEIFDY